MQIIKNQDILKRQSSNYIKGELSNVAMAIQNSPILVDYYPINADLSPTLSGFKNVEDFIGPESPVVYDHIEKFPMAGIDNLTTTAQFDEELGFDEDLQSSGMIFPNTIVAKPYDLFMIPNGVVPALYIVTNIIPTTVRSNPFVEIQFRLFSRDPKVIAQMKRQVRTEYVTTVTAIGPDKSLVITKENYFKIEDHIKSYLEILDLYRTLFWDAQRSGFIFSSLYDETTDSQIEYIDVVLWRLMFDFNIIICDDVITYGINNLNMKIRRTYTSDPDKYVDDHNFKRSILYRLLTRDHKNDFAEFKFPQSYSPDPRYGKYTGQNLYYFEFYDKQCDCNLMCTQMPVWDDEFVDRIRNNQPYEECILALYLEKQQESPCDDTGCGPKVTEYPFNPYLRNAIIAWYNGTRIDWENLIIEDKKTSENYFLLPIILGAYKHYIGKLQK